MQAIGSAMQGINQATQLLNSSPRQIAQNGPEVEPIVQSKIAETSFEANVASAKSILEVEETALDLLA